MDNLGSRSDLEHDEPETTDSILVARIARLRIVNHLTVKCADFAASQMAVMKMSTDQTFPALKTIMVMVCLIFQK